MTSADTRRTERSGMSSETILRAKARSAMEGGRLPVRRPDNVWGGRASRSDCPVCRVPLKTGEIVFEIQYAAYNGTGPMTHDVHVRCYVCARRRMGRARGSHTRGGFCSRFA